MSKVVKQGEVMTEQCGTLAYIAPEILKDRGYKDFAADVWSAGVVLYAMIYGTVPFRTGDIEELRELIIRGDYTLKEDVSEDVRDLLEHMLEVNPKKRYTIPQILCHRWFSNYDPSMKLFTKEEEEDIAREFASTERAERNRQTETTESDWFVEQDLDRTQYELTRNASTKSAILAPFNSNASGKSCKPAEAAVLHKRVIKLNPKVKEIDRQYERNNNCEVDNGVYNKAAYIHDKAEFLGEKHSPKSHPAAEAKAKPSPAQSKAVQESLLKSLVPKPLVINEALVRRIADLGYPFEYIMEALGKSLRNHATTTYFLLLSQQHNC